MSNNQETQNIKIKSLLSVPPHLIVKKSAVLLQSVIQIYFALYSYCYV
jgi:hypothetical protein